MATKKYKIQQLQSDETLLTLHPETDASIVKVDTSKTGTTATNVEGALKELKDTIVSSVGGGVTGVKGSAESTYRQGNVEITKANIGLGNVNNTSDLDKPISTATQQAIDNVIAIANGKTKTYVISYASTSNTAFNSNEDKIDFHYDAQFYDDAGKPFHISDLKLGDVILVKETDVPDRYVGKYVVSGSVYDVSFYKLETRKIDLSGYVAKNSDTATNLTLEDTTTFKENSVIDMSKSGVSISIGNNAISGQGLGSIKFGTGTGFHFEDLTANILSFRNSESNAVYDLTVPTKSGTIALQSNKTGSYSAVTVENGIVTEGAQMFEVGVTNQTEPSANLAIGGIFFKEI